MNNLDPSKKNITRNLVIYVWLLAALITALSGFVHNRADASLTIQQEQYWERAKALHENSNSFKARPLTTKLMDFLHNQFGWTLKFSFLSLQFILMFLAGPIFYQFLKRLRFGHSYALAGMMIYLLSYPFFLAFFEPLYTWDDLWTYCAIPLAFSLLFDRRILLSTLVISIAIIARETAIIFLPIWIWLLTRQKIKLSTIITLTLLALLPMLGYRYMISDGTLAERTLLLDDNFNSFERGRDSLYYAFISLGFVWLVGIYQALRSKCDQRPFSDVIRFAALFVAVGTILSTSILSFMHENRIFFPAAIFLIPMTLGYIEQEKETLKSIWKTRYNKFLIPTGLIILYAVIRWVSKLIIPKFHFYSNTSNNWTFLALHLSLVCLFLILLWNKKRLKSRQVTE